MAWPPLPLPAHDPQPITRSIVQVLPQPQVALGGLDRGVPQGNLDLLERSAAEVGELGEGSPEIVRPVRTPSRGRGYRVTPALGAK